MEFSSYSAGGLMDPNSQPSVLSGPDTVTPIGLTLLGRRGLSGGMHMYSGSGRQFMEP